MSEHSLRCRSSTVNDAAPSVSPRLGGLPTSSRSERKAIGDGVHANVEGRHDRRERKAFDDFERSGPRGEREGIDDGTEAETPRAPSPLFGVLGSSGRRIDDRVSLPNLGAGRMGDDDLHVREIHFL